MRCIPKYFIIPTVAEVAKIRSDLLDTPNCVTGLIRSDARKTLLSCVTFVPTVTLNVSPGFGTANGGAAICAIAGCEIADNHVSAIAASQKRKKRLRQERFSSDILFFKVLIFSCGYR